MPNPEKFQRSAVSFKRWSSLDEMKYRDAAFPLQQCCAIHYLKCNITDVAKCTCTLKFSGNFLTLHFISFFYQPRSKYCAFAPERRKIKRCIAISYEIYFYTFHFWNFALQSECWLNVNTFF